MSPILKNCGGSQGCRYEVAKVFSLVVIVLLDGCWFIKNIRLIAWKLMNMKYKRLKVCSITLKPRGHYFYRQSHFSLSRMSHVCVIQVLSFALVNCDES